MKLDRSITIFKHFLILPFYLLVGLLNAQDTLYYSNGAIKEIKVYSEDQNLVELLKCDKKQKLILREWYRQGKLSYAERYEKWYRNGGVLFTKMTFFENGNIAEIGKCKWTKSYYYTHEKCTPIGKWRTFYESGQLKEIGRYNKTNGRTGKWKSYHENGRLEEKGKYNDSNCIGKWKLYDTKGRLVETYSYDD
jgi:antitoxin component YwqK of YwqJK toxin-antitoxin module